MAEHCFKISDAGDRVKEDPLRRGEYFGPLKEVIGGDHGVHEEICEGVGFGLQQDPSVVICDNKLLKDM